MKKTELLKLFTDSIDQSLTLYESSIRNNTHIALGLAELALEELGKSYSCLAYYSQIESMEKVFIKEMKDHTIKAHRGFFYEFFNVKRIELIDNKVQKNSPSFIKLKELSFYSDLNHNPKNSTRNKEDIRLKLNLIYLINTALTIKTMIEENRNEEYIKAISDYAFRTITTNMYQQDVLDTLKSMKNKKSHSYNKAINDIESFFKKNNQSQ